MQWDSGQGRSLWLRWACLSLEDHSQGSSIGQRSLFSRASRGPASYAHSHHPDPLWPLYLKESVLSLQYPILPIHLTSHPSMYPLFMDLYRPTIHPPNRPCVHPSRQLSVHSSTHASTAHHPAMLASSLSTSPAVPTQPAASQPPTHPDSCLSTQHPIHQPSTHPCTQLLPMSFACSQSSLIPSAAFLSPQCFSVTAWCLSDGRGSRREAWAWPHPSVLPRKAGADAGEKGEQSHQGHGRCVRMGLPAWSAT